MADAEQPTDEGRKRYEADGFYVVDADWRIACTCKPTCPADCKGECGCKACEAAYQDFLSQE
jgi:hypothetical protein